MKRPGGSRSLRPALVSLPAALLAAGCAMVGPDYQPPPLDAPAQWSTPADTRAPDPLVLAEWWRLFGDALLDGLVGEALAGNLDLATARARVREARAQRRLAAAQLGPSLEFSGSASRTKASAESGSGGTGGLYRAGFDAGWEADLFGGLRRGVEAAQADLEVTVEQLRDTRVSLAAEVVVTYVELRTAERRMAVTRQNLVAQRGTYDLVRWRRQAGLASELDVAQARTEVESTRAELPSLQTAVSEAQNRLAVLLGRPPGAPVTRLATSGLVPFAPRDASVGIPADTLRHRPDVRAAERELAAQTARLGVAEAARYPSLTLSGSLGLEALAWSTLGNGSATAASLLGSITAPIFDSGRIEAEIGVQDALLEQARLAYRSTVLGALQEVENALVTVSNAEERRSRLQQAADSAQGALRLAEQRYAAGLADFLAVLDSQRSALLLEEQLAVSAGDLATAQVQLYKALGGGWSAAVEPHRKENNT